MQQQEWTEGGYGAFVPLPRRAQRHAHGDFSSTAPSLGELRAELARRQHVRSQARRRCSSALLSMALSATTLAALGLVWGATRDGTLTPLAAPAGAAVSHANEYPEFVEKDFKATAAASPAAAAAAVAAAEAAAAGAANARENAAAAGGVEWWANTAAKATPAEADAEEQPSGDLARQQQIQQQPAPADDVAAAAAPGDAGVGRGSTIGPPDGSRIGKKRKEEEKKAEEKKIGGDQPNVVFLLIDDMGYNDIGYQSTDLAGFTPNLDAMAAKGVKLTNYYSSYLCTPARSTLMTGRNPYRYGLQYSVILPSAPYGLSLEEKLLPQYMSSAGYRSHMVGKWHLGSYQEGYLPHRRGFETFLGYLNDEEDYYTHQGWTIKLAGRTFGDFGYADQEAGYIDPETGVPYGSRAAVGQYSTDIFTQRAIDVVTSHASDTPEQPLFLYLAYQAVHDPLGPPPNGSLSEADEAMLARIPTKELLRVRFAEVLLYLDRQVGYLMSELESLGYMDNTLIVVASDNGGCPLYGGSNYPLRGIKHSYWEGGSKVPAFVYGPGLLPDSVTGTEFSGIFSVADWVPTLAALGAAELSEDTFYDGVDQWGGITAQEEPPRDFVVFNFDTYQENPAGSEDIIEIPPKGAIRVGRWKLIVQDWCAGYYSFSVNDKYEEDVCGELGTCWICGGTCVNKPHYKPASYLFDLENDPTEHYNLIDSYPEVAERLRRQWLSTSLANFEPTHQKVQMQSSAEHVWEHHGDCMVPWWDIFQEHNDTSKPDVGGDHTRPSGGDAASHLLPGETTKDPKVTVTVQSSNTTVNVSSNTTVTVSSNTTVNVIVIGAAASSSSSSSSSSSTGGGSETASSSTGSSSGSSGGSSSGSSGGSSSGSSGGSSSGSSGGSSSGSSGGSSSGSSSSSGSGSSSSSLLAHDVTEQLSQSPS